MAAPPVLSASLPDALLVFAAAELDRRATVGDDNAALDDRQHFLRGALVIPTRGRAEPALILRAWLAVERRDYKRALALWRSPRRAAAPPIAGALASSIPGYPSTLGLAGELRAAPPGRDLVLALARGLDHPLGRDAELGLDPVQLAALRSALGSS